MTIEHFLLRLPAELRHEIYKYLLFDKDDEFNLCLTNSSSNKAPFLDALDVLQAVSPLIRSDAWEFVHPRLNVILKTSTTVPAPLIRLLRKRVPTKDLAKIKKVSIPHLTIQSLRVHIPSLSCECGPPPAEPAYECPCNTSVLQAINHGGSDMDYNPEFRYELKISMHLIRATFPSLRYLRIGIDILECLPTSPESFAITMRKVALFGWSKVSHDVFNMSVQSLKMMKGIDKMKIEIIWVESISKLVATGVGDDWSDVIGRLKKCYLEKLREVIPAAQITGCDSEEDCNE